jgi:hypothetical protein
MPNCFPQIPFVVDFFRRHFPEKLPLTLVATFLAAMALWPPRRLGILLSNRKHPAGMARSEI